MRVLSSVCLAILITPLAPAAVQRVEITFDFVREIARARERALPGGSG
ncbi:MAG: hypothetical protein RIQ93_2966 [Verrucomicrobiota bacterium]|jgi:hypothetical protein